MREDIYIIDARIVCRHGEPFLGDGHGTHGHDDDARTRLSCGSLSIVPV